MPRGVLFLVFFFLKVDVGAGKEVIEEARSALLSSSPVFSPSETIRRKRDGKELSDVEINAFVDAFHSGNGGWMTTT